MGKGLYLCWVSCPSWRCQKRRGGWWWRGKSQDCPKTSCDRNKRESEYQVLQREGRGWNEKCPFWFQNLHWTSKTIPLFLICSWFWLFLWRRMRNLTTTWPMMRRRKRNVECNLKSQKHKREWKNRFDLISKLPIIWLISILLSEQRREFRENSKTVKRSSNEAKYWGLSRISQRNPRLKVAANQTVPIWQFGTFLSRRNAWNMQKTTWRPSWRIGKYTSQFKNLFD